MQKILGQVRRCVEDYHMIDAGDVVAVGVSGAKALAWAANKPIYGINHVIG